MHHCSTGAYCSIALQTLRCIAMDQEGGQKLKPTRLCLYQAGGRLVPAGTSARVQCHMGGASLVGATCLALLLFSDLFAERYPCLCRACQTVLSKSGSVRNRYSTERGWNKPSGSVCKDRTHFEPRWTPVRHQGGPMGRRAPVPKGLAKMPRRGAF